MLRLRDPGRDVGFSSCVHLLEGVCCAKRIGDILPHGLQDAGGTGYGAAPGQHDAQHCCGPGGAAAGKAEASGCKRQGCRGIPGAVARISAITLARLPFQSVDGDAWQVVRCRLES